MDMMVLLKKYVSIIFLVGVVISLSFLFISSPFANHKDIQPIAFNHKAHIENAGMTCKDCHLNVETMAVATIPALEVCQTCHNEEPVSKSPVEKEVLKYVAEKKEIPWVQIYKVPEQVYFSHRRHVTIAALECSECHGNVAAMATPVSYETPRVTMKNCMDCHKQHKVTNDCIACHR